MKFVYHHYQGLFENEGIVGKSVRGMIQSFVIRFIITVIL